MSPSIKGHVLVTGGTDGIGRITCARLAQKGYQVILHGRNEDKAHQVADQISKDLGIKLDLEIADFSSLEQVKAMAYRLREKYASLQILINNAALGPGPKDKQHRSLSQDGYEMIFAVNYLAPFLLTNLLLPLLLKAEQPRVINVTSIAQSLVDFDNLMLEEGYTGSKAYSQSKMALTMFTIELDHRLKGKSISVNCLHPGSLLNTKMVEEAFGYSWGKAESGADAIEYLATSHELDKVSGKYFNQKNIDQLHEQALNESDRKKLWQISQKLTNFSLIE